MSFHFFLIFHIMKFLPYCLLLAHFGFCAWPLHSVFTWMSLSFYMDLSSGRPPGCSIKDTIKEWGCNNWWTYVILVIVRDIIIMWDLSSGRPPGCTESQVLYFRRRSQFLQIDSIERYLTFSFLLCLTSLHPEMRDLIKSHIFFECLQRFYYTFLMVLISVWRIKMAKMFQ